MQRSKTFPIAFRAIVFTLFSAGCGAQFARAPTAANPASDNRLDAILWQTTSAEYRVIAQSTYAAATAYLERALSDRQWTAQPQQNFQDLPPAVIMDIDETVLDTGRFQSHLVKGQRRFSTAVWREWMSQNDPPAIPGAIEFISQANSRGVTVFFVTNRDYATEAATRRQLKSVGIKLPDHIDTVLCANEQPDWDVDKGSRRRYIAERYRVLMIFGDDLGDFISGHIASPDARTREADKHQHWGTKWFMLPNPMYGSWESSLFDFKSGLSAAEISQRKFQRLQKGE